MTADPNRCPSRIAHESGAVRRCLRIHDPIEQPWHEAGDATWLDGDDRVLAELNRASAGNVKRGDLLDVVLDTGEEYRFVVVDDPKVDADGTVRFEAADPERVAAVERIAAIGQWPDQPTNADTAVEQLEVHHRRGKERTDEERAALEPRYATGGPVKSDVDGDNPPSWLTGCTYDNGGYIPPGVIAYRNDTGKPYVVNSGMPDPSLIPGMVEVPVPPFVTDQEAAR